MRPNIRQIEAFNAVVKGGSVTRAAEVLLISQPAVSKLIAAFESACGLTLFDRSNQRLTPTPEAKRLFSETEKFMTGVERVEHAAKVIREAERGELVVAGFPGISLRALPHYAAHFLATHPDIRLSILTRNSPDVAAAMISRMADFGISLLPTRQAEVRCRPFLPISMVCAIPAGHRLVERDRIDLRDLDGERLIGLGTDDQSSRVVTEALVRAGSRPQQVIDVEMAHTACALVSEGLGVALVHSLAVTGWENQKLVFRPLVQKVQMTTWLYTSSWGPMPHLAQLLLQTFQEGVEKVEQGFYPEPPSP